MSQTTSVAFALNFPQGTIIFTERAGSYFMPTGTMDAFQIYGEHKELFGKKAISVRGNRNTASTYGQVVFGPKAIVSQPAQPPTPKRSGYHGLVSAIVEFFKTGKSPVPIEDSVEIMAFMEAADVSKARGGAPVPLAEVLAVK